MSQSYTDISAIMAQAQAGDKVAYEKGLRESAVIIRRFLHKKNQDEEIIEDIVQETLLAVHKALHTYDPKRPFASWLFAIANYKLQDYLRGLYRRHRTEEVDYDKIEHFLEAEDVTETLHIHEDIERMLNHLNDRERLIIVKMKYEGYSAAEVAHQLEMGLSAVKVAAHRAYAKLQKIIENEHE